MDVDDQQVLVEHRGAVLHRSVGSHHHRAAVEDELVLAADGVHVGDPRAGLARAIAQDRRAVVDLAPVVRRAVDVHDQRHARVGARTAGRRARRPRRPSAPAPSSRTVARHGVGSRREVAPLVEHPEVRQLASCGSGRGRRRRRAARPRCGSRRRSGRRTPRRPGSSSAVFDARLRSAARLSSHELTAEHEVLGRVAGDRELGEARRGRRRPRWRAAPASAMRATLPARSPTVRSSWPSAMRGTAGSLRGTATLGEGGRDVRARRAHPTRCRRCRRCTPPRRGRRPSAGGGSPCR